jgi:hypothetical protein
MNGQFDRCSAAFCCLYNERKQFTPSGLQGMAVEEIWVTTSEGAARTGYNAEYVGVLAMKMWKLPEGAREIKLRKRSGRYELWLPDLIAYTEKRARGPQPKRKPLTT